MYFIYTDDIFADTSAASPSKPKEKKKKAVTKDKSEKTKTTEAIDDPLS